MNKIILIILLLIFIIIFNFKKNVKDGFYILNEPVKIDNWLSIDKFIIKNNSNNLSLDSEMIKGDFHYKNKYGYVIINENTNEICQIIVKPNGTGKIYKISILNINKGDELSLLNNVEQNKYIKFTFKLK